jgi:hypothetical protein
MAKMTIRDQTWKATIDLAVNGLDKPPGTETEIEAAGEWYNEAYEGVGFTKNELLDRVDAGDRTVHDVLKTMVKMGLLCESERRLRRLMKPGKTGNTDTVYNTVYYPAGDIATEEVKKSDLIGWSVPGTDTDDEAVEEFVEANADTLQ